MWRFGLKDAAREMADSLMWEAKQKGIDLSGLTIDNFNCYLDDAFDDGGEVRCERFTDLAIEYALEFGEFDSDGFSNAQWDAIEEAIGMIQNP